MSISTADLYDQNTELVQVVEPLFSNFGGHDSFSGEVVTLKIFEDNQLVRTVLETPGAGRVLVVDGGGSYRCALVGDLLAELAIRNEWAGIIVYGCIRDSKAIGGMSIGVQALGTNPRKSVKKGEGTRDIALSFGGVTFESGDWVYADEDGILVSKTKLS